MRYIIFLFFIPLLLIARENPFFPVDNEQDIPLTTNQVDIVPPLKRVSVKLPSTARTVERITVEYKNLDGSIATKKIELHNGIDWHLPLFISQNYNDTTTKKVKNNSFKERRKSSSRYKKIASLKFISFYENGKKLKILTKDKMLRSFLLVKPHRIVCDFKRQTDFGVYMKKVASSSLFKKIRLGTHKGYYRVVIELDGYYRYKIKKTASGYIYTLL